MRRVTNIVISLAMMLGAISCNRHTVIPDDVLVSIFHDAFLVNAYVEEEGVDIDSLKIYEPIFRRYGYTAEDVRYTVGNFSRRKSARLGTIVEEAISRLEEEGKLFAKQVVVLDTIRNVAMRKYTRVIYEDSLIQARRRADSTRLRIVIEPVYRGSYHITYKATCEDDLEKYPRQAEFYFESEDGVRNGVGVLTMREQFSANRTLVSHKEDHSRLIIELGRYKDTSKRPPKRQSLDIRNLKVVYKPNEELAIDSLYEHYLPIKIFVDGFLIKKDSLTLSADSTRVVSPTADNR